MPAATAGAKSSDALFLPRGDMPSAPTPRLLMFVGAFSLHNYCWVQMGSQPPAFLAAQVFACAWAFVVAKDGVVSCSYSISICHALGSDFLYIMYSTKQRLAQDHAGQCTSMGSITDSFLSLQLSNACFSVL